MKTNTHPTLPFRESLEDLERIIEAAEAVKYEIETTLDLCEDESRSSVREILCGLNLRDIEDIEGGLLDLKEKLGPLA